MSSVVTEGGYRHANGPKGPFPPEPARRSGLPPLTAFAPPGVRPRYVRVEAPCSIANVGPGFDHLAVALASPVDTLELRYASRWGFEVVGDSDLPASWEENAAGVAARSLFQRFGPPGVLRARLVKGFRGSSGIGSSGASAAAGAFAAAALLGLDPEDPGVVGAVVEAALAGEEAASGARHLDNVAASLFGGLTFSEAEDPPRVHSVWPGAPATWVIAVPDLRLSTRESRGVLPAQVPFGDAVINVARASGLLLGWVQGDLALVGRNFGDRLAEPYRAPLVPGFEVARRRALAAGSYGVMLSGSGPALAALVPPTRVGAVGKAFREAFHSVGRAVDVLTSGVGAGARLTGWS